MKRIRGKKQPLSSAGLYALRDEYTKTIVPSRAQAGAACPRLKAAFGVSAQVLARRSLISGILSLER